MFFCLRFGINTGEYLQLRVVTFSLTITSFSDPLANKLGRVICYAKLFNSFLAHFNMEGIAIPHSP